MTSFLGKLRGDARGGSQLELLLLIGMMAVCVMAGMRVAGARFRGMVTRQTACVDQLSSAPGCVPGSSDSEGAAPERRAMIDGAAGVASLRSLTPTVARLRMAPAQVRDVALPPERLARLWAPGALPIAEHAPRASAKSFLQTVEVLAGSAYATAAPALGPIGGSMLTASRTTATTSEVSDTPALSDALPELEGCFTVPGGGGESIQVTTTIGQEEVTAEVSASNVFVHSGRTFVTVSFRASRAQVAELEADLGRHGFEVKLGVGEYVMISVTVPVGSDGKACVPSLTAPASWPAGTAVRFEVGVEASGSGSVTVYGLQVGSSHSQSEGLVVAVIKTDADHVMIVGGTTEAMANAGWFGVSLGVVGAGIISEDEHRIDELVIAEIDVGDGSVRTGTMTVESAGGKVSGYVSLDAGVEIRFQWTMTENGWELRTTRYRDGQVVETHTVFDQSGRVTYSFVDGVQGDLTVSYLVDGGTARVFPYAPQCLDPDRDYVVQWVATPADVDALVAFVASRHEKSRRGESDHVSLHTNCIAGAAVPMYEVDPPFQLGGFAQVLAYCSPLELETLLREYHEETGQTAGRLEILDPDTGLSVSC